MTTRFGHLCSAPRMILDCRSKGRNRTKCRSVFVMVAALVFTLVAVLIAKPALAQTESNEAVSDFVDPRAPIQVVTKPIEPFVYVDGHIAQGFSIDLWQAVADVLERPYETRIVATIDEQLDAVTSGQADVGIAAISITKEREEVMDFSYPYFESGLGILVARNERTSFGHLLAAAFSPNMLRLLAGLAVFIVLAGHLVWFLERRNDSDFNSGYVRGVSEGIWWATATVTTVGYGDHVPRKALGRAFGLFWMVAGVFILANFTANVTTELTVNRLNETINGPQDLPGKRIVTIGGSTADLWLSNQGLAHNNVTDTAEAYALVDSGDVQAFVYDYPVLLYYTLTNSDEQLVVVSEPFNQEDYGIALPENSPLREDVNLALLQLYESGTYDQIATKWFGVADSQ